MRKLWFSYSQMANTAIELLHSSWRKFSTSPSLHGLQLGWRYPQIWRYPRDLKQKRYPWLRSVQISNKSRIFSQVISQIVKVKLCSGTTIPRLLWGIRCNKRKAKIFVIWTTQNYKIRSRVSCNWNLSAEPSDRTNNFMATPKGQPLGSSTYSKFQLPPDKYQELRV